MWNPWSLTVKGRKINELLDCTCQNSCAGAAPFHRARCICSQRIRPKTMSHSGYSPVLPRQMTEPSFLESRSRPRAAAMPSQAGAESSV